MPSRSIIPITMVSLERPLRRDSELGKSEVNQPQNEDAVIMDSTIDEKRYSFEIPSDPIPDSKIVNTIESEIVIIGAGTAGLVCANSAVENGANVTLIAASSHPVSRGGSNHAINSSLMRKLGIVYDVGKSFKQEIDRAGGRIDQDKWSLFANNSEEAMDWLIEKMEAAGYTAAIETADFDPDGVFSSFPGSHCFLGGNINQVGQGQSLVVNTLAKLAAESGVRIFYDMVAKQLVRDNNSTGRINAVIAKNSEGSYIKYVGSKAIVLATGDFTKDREMVSKYCPEVLTLVSRTPVDYNTQRASGGIYAGDGHKMALWVGAAWQQTDPNAPMLSGGVGPSPSPYASFKGLLINKNAVRYGNEDVNRTHAGYIQIRQPECKVYAVWDSTYAERMAPWYSRGYYDSPPQSSDSIVAGWETAVKAGTILKAESLEKLAEGLGLNSAKLMATVDKYNESCDKGVHEDFFKRPELLIPVREAPFYGQCNSMPRLLIVCGGLRTNVKMQVLDTKGLVITGLYAVGTIAGDMFANYYSFMPSGINLGANCLTFGYIAGKQIAGS
ncbi:MAG: FAD-dependent oxidoreductase [Dehalococcoidales bacterium]|nr:MAG: FAD-dependent oxidoreductase [Dehalococcoidales bacterium]